jgi:hypothetical protein
MRLLAFAQGIYYMATGAWAIVHLDSFQAVTGAKTDLWLVKTVGLLVTVIGAAVFASRKRPVLTPEMLIVACGSALALGTVDVVYALRGTISKIYLLDALPEAVLVVGWSVVWHRQRRARLPT